MLAVNGLSAVYHDGCVVHEFVALVLVVCLLVLCSRLMIFCFGLVVC